MGLALVLTILAVAAGLVILDAALLARREWHNARIREAFRARVFADLARDRVVHDRVRQLPLAEEADDYLERIRPVFDAEATRIKGPWRKYGKPRFVARASAQTGNQA